MNKTQHKKIIRAKQKAIAEIQKTLNKYALVVQEVEGDLSDKLYSMSDKRQQSEKGIELEKQIDYLQNLERDIEINIQDEFNDRLDCSFE